MAAVFRSYCPSCASSSDTRRYHPGGMAYYNLAAVFAALTQHLMHNAARHAGRVPMHTVPVTGCVLCIICMNKSLLTRSISPASTSLPSNVW